MTSNRKWHFWIDRGGTFTDIIAQDPDGKLVTHKLLSENPSLYTDAALEGIHRLMRVQGREQLPTSEIAAIKMGTTVATNALLERKGERTVFVTTKGFKDALRIGYQNRTEIFALKIKRPELLYERVIEVDERISAQGEIISPLDTAGAEKFLADARAAGISAVAICFMHGYRFQSHEKQVAEIARKIGFNQISTSHVSSPLMKYVSRGDTTVVDAYLSPILRRYIDRVQGALDGADDSPQLMFMQSNGGLTDASLFQGKDAILSGPAAGVVGMVQTSLAAGFENIIGFDMGGTSTDVSHYNGDLERVYETDVAGVRMRAPMMYINTVAAGGGSILKYDGARMRVGPESAGADPGPVAYRKGGPLTVTDANIMVGKLHPEFFPAAFGPNGADRLDKESVSTAFQNLTKRINSDRMPEQIAHGFILIAIENMAQAIKKISVSRGYDVSGYVLTCFGGAGAQHACLVADALNMRSILIHPFASLLSAFGIGLADIRAHRELTIERKLNESTLLDLNSAIDNLKKDVRQELLNQNIDNAEIETRTSLHIRYEGTDTALTVDHGNLSEVQSRSRDTHQQRFGFYSEDKALIIEAISVEGIGHATPPMPQDPIEKRKPNQEKPIPQTRQIFTDEGWSDAQIFDRAALLAEDKVNGPALIIEPHTTIVIEPGWQAELTATNNVVLTRVKAKKRGHAIGTKVDPVMLEIFNNLFMSIAEQMGYTLEKTASSVNIKERLDFSCAIFDWDGSLIANAPHMPVHLGSMSVSVKTIIEQNQNKINKGDVFVLNAPYNGGTHLPDVTVIAPVFDQAGADVLFFTGARGHHADIGGISPGSMPPMSRNVKEEGVLINNFKLIEGGKLREKDFIELLTTAPHPARNVLQNLADLKAQIAACEKGAQELTAMVADYGLDVVKAYMGHIQDNAEECVRRVIDVLSDSEFALPLDNGAEIKVTIRVNKINRAATIDFTGTSDQLEDNFNAPTAVARAVVLYVFRCMIADDIPLNDGCLKPLDIVIAEGSMLRPNYPAAVVAGNVETSQHLTDALFGALGVMAAAQGTMNNLTFGNETYQYYETICGGSGAGKMFDGTDAIHTHMTNSRLTDPEVLEWRLPVLLQSFEIRAGSGGAGRHKGGNGTVRRLTFRKPMKVSVLSTRRKTEPFGIVGGKAGKCGCNWIQRADGSIETLRGCDTTEAAAGDTIIIETPGGGGYGHC